MTTSRAPSKFMLKPSTLSQHTAKFNEILEQLPAPKIDPLDLVSPSHDENSKKNDLKVSNNLFVEKKQTNGNDTEKNEDKEKTGSQPTENTANEEAPVKEFVFGEKLNDRVTINLTKNGESTSENGDNATASNSTKRKSYDAEDQDSKDETNETSETAAKTLWSTENNGDYFDPNENNENTLFKINCKLYLLEADKANWVERGYGILKVIDSNDDLNCNIMMWTDKCFRLILHTKMFEKMQIDRANKKSIRFNAFDNGTIRVFLVKTGNPNDCDELFEVLSRRLNEFNIKSSKLSSLDNESPSKYKNTKSVIFSCNCNISDTETNITGKVQLFTYASASTAENASLSSNHQLLLDLIDNESKILLSTQLKLVKLKSQKFKPSEDATTELKNSHFEFDISTSVASFSSADLSSKNKSKYTVLIEDKELANKFLVLYNKEPKFRTNFDDSSNEGDDDEENDDENNTQEDDDQNTEYEPIRKSNSIHESERYGSSEEENANDSCSIETGDINNRKRKNYDSDNIPNAFKKQDLESSDNLESFEDKGDDAEGEDDSNEKKSNSNKRNLDDCSNQENLESNFKKTKHMTEQTGDVQE